MGHENRGRPLLHPGSLGFAVGPGARCGRHVHVQARARCFVPLVPIKTGPELKNSVRYVHWRQFNRIRPRLEAGNEG